MGSLFKRKGILSGREQELRVREQDLLDRLATTLERFGPDVDADDLRRFKDARAQLDGMFLLVVAGEFNSGKSSFINALLGERVLPEGVTPTTDRINVLRHGVEPGERSPEPFLLERTHPSPLLREINIVDTPGTNAIIRRHEELTRDFVPRSDLVLFITSADRPFTESERGFLEHIRQWGKKIIVIVNKVDILQNMAEREQVVAFVRENAGQLLGTRPEVFAVSARQAMNARVDGNEALWTESGFGDVETYLLHTLDQEERVRLKLLNPLNVGARLASIYKDKAFERLKLLAGDVETLENINRQLAIFHEEMLREFEPRLSFLGQLLLDMERRGDVFFEDTIRIGRIRKLIDNESIRRTFEHEVIANTPEQIQAEVDRIVDWIVERNLKVWQDINAHIDRRQLARHNEDLIGDIGQQFTYNRQALLNSVGRVAQDTIRAYNRELESREMANQVQGAFATTALAEVGAIGIGTLVATVLAGAAADVTGILLAATLAVGGLYVLPRKRRQAKKALHEKLNVLRRNLIDSLTRQVHREIEESTQQINEAIAPYRRFVKSQQAQLTEAHGELVAVEDALTSLRADIEHRPR